MAARRHMRVVMLVGGDDAVARACARVSAPLPVVRTRHVDVAVERLRELRPVAVYIASDVSAEHESSITKLAGAQSTPCIRLADASDAWTGVEVSTLRTSPRRA